LNPDFVPLTQKVRKITKNSPYTNLQIKVSFQQWAKSKNFTAKEKNPLIFSFIKS